MSTFILTYAFIGLFIMVLAVILASRRKGKSEELELKKLNTEIKTKRAQLETLTFDHNVNLTKLEIFVLEQYDMNNIRIPVDIIEDLHNMKLTTESDIFNFIESQRNYWKLENTKKIFRRGVK
jgi:hypothetical protein